MTADLHWSAAYIGLPYREFGRDRRGLDCWGLACLVYREQLGIDLPSYAERYTSVEEHTELSAIIGDATGSATWTRVDRPEIYDVAVFRRGRQTVHVGIVITAGLMLHTSEGRPSRIEHFSTGPWSHRLAGIFRHHDLIARAQHDR